MTKTSILRMLPPFFQHFFRSEKSLKNLISRVFCKINASIMPKFMRHIVSFTLPAPTVRKSKNENKHL